MRALVLCNSCKRHVKTCETLCPFCCAAVVLERKPSAGSRRGLPGGRAALFLTGAVLAAAGCADEPEPDALDNGPHAGPEAGVQRANDAGVVTDAGRDAGILVAQPYGIAIDRWDASIVTPKDAGPSCPQVGNLPVPVYGIGIDVPPVDVCKDAGADAGPDAGKDAGGDGGADAGKDAGTDAGKDAGLMAAPTYGIAIDTGR